MTWKEVLKIISDIIDKAYLKCQIRNYIEKKLLDKDIEEFKVIPKSETEYDIFIKPKIDICEIELTFIMGKYNDKI
jgi:hypothetical protein